MKSQIISIYDPYLDKPISLNLNDLPVLWKFGRRIIKYVSKKKWASTRGVIRSFRLDMTFAFLCVKLARRLTFREALEYNELLEYSDERYKLFKHIAKLTLREDRAAFVQHLAKHKLSTYFASRYLYANFNVESSEITEDEHFHRIFRDFLNYYLSTIKYSKMRFNKRLLSHLRKSASEFCNELEKLMGEKNATDQATRSSE